MFTVVHGYEEEITARTRTLHRLESCPTRAGNWARWEASTLVGVVGGDQKSANATV